MVQAMTSRQEQAIKCCLIPGSNGDSDILQKTGNHTSHGLGTQLDNNQYPTVYSVEADREQETLSDLLNTLSMDGQNRSSQALAAAQAQDPEVQKFIDLVEHGELPDDETLGRKLALQKSLFTMVDGALCYVDPKRNNRKQAVVPQSLKEQILTQTHSGPFGGHFSGQRMFNSPVLNWWWEHYV